MYPSIFIPALYVLAYVGTTTPHAFMCYAFIKPYTHTCIHRDTYTHTHTYTHQHTHTHKHTHNNTHTHTHTHTRKRIPTYIQT